jgi:MATE family multidrug resistance protein
MPGRFRNPTPAGPRDAQPTLARRFLRLSALNVLASITVPLSSLIDTAMLGHLPEVRFLAGVALASVLFDVLYWSFGFLRMGTTGTTAMALGRDDRHEVYLTLLRGLLIAVVAGGLMVLLQAPLRELGFHLLTGAAAVESAGRAYFGARIWAAPATLANFAFLGWFLGREESGRALVLTAVGNLSNVALNYVFIVRLGWAAYGAGLGTAISQYLVLALALALTFAHWHREKPSFRLGAVFERGPLGRLMRLNRDILIRTFGLVGTFAIFTNFAAVMGTVLLAAFGILLRLLELASFVIDGAAYATESLAGQLAGAEDVGRLRRLLSMAHGFGLTAALIFIAVLLAFPQAILALLTSQDATLADAIRFLPWLCVTVLAGAPAYILDGYFLGLTAGRDLRNAMLISVGLGFLPLALAAWRWHNPHLLWAALAGFMLVRVLTLSMRARQVSAGAESDGR